MEHHRMIDTRLATVERVSEQLVEVRFKPDVKLDAEGMGEMIRAKQQVTGSSPVDVLTVMPPEVEFELNVLTQDHLGVHGGCGQSRRMAFVAQSPLNLRLADIYFRYHPRSHDTAVFMQEPEAREWLASGVPRTSLS